MNILILGNGFDLAHDLKTKYSNFLDYCREKYNNLSSQDVSSKVFFTNVWIKHFINKKNTQNLKGENWIDLEKEIYNILATIHPSDSNIPPIFSLDQPFPSTKNSQSIFPFILKDDTFSLINFHDKLQSFQGEPLKKSSYVVYQKECYVQFASSRGIIDYLYDQLREFTKEFEKYLLNEVLDKMNPESEFLLSLDSLGVNGATKNLYILNFNYTNTFERFYESQINKIYSELRVRSIHVHGKATTSEDCNLVLGTQSFNNEQNSKKLPTDFNIFQKHYQRHKYATIEQYQDLLRDIKQTRETVIFSIIGHSLDRTDHNILKHILLANPNSKINIYYHDEEAQERFMNNINAIIGEEEVMARVRFIHQHDDPRSILKRKNKTPDNCSNNQ